MTRKNLLMAQFTGAAVMIWLIVWAICHWADSRRATAERVAEMVRESPMADWSDKGESVNQTQAAEREKKIKALAEVVNQLDFNEREKNRNNHEVENFFRRLSPSEKRQFVDLTVRESMTKFMEALDALPAEERKRFVQQGLREVTEGRTGDDLARVQEMGPDVLDRITSEGMRAYFEKASADTKLDLAPLMQSINEVMQGMRGQPFGPGAR
jgi:DNA-directed RNA polymerase specialized sigma24 family protein